MNRLKDFFERPPEPERSDDFFEIETHYDTFAVSRETASAIERELDASPTPRWIVFRSLSAARHRILAAHVYCVSESTAAQRATSREFRRARRLEEKADRRPWEDD
jgi:hypothetical protein